MVSNRRGLTAGRTAAGFGMGSALTIIAIQAISRGDGYRAALLYFGITQGAIVCLLSFGLLAPRKA